ncbi:hypothetical protein CWR48_12280 [Oceanobacillus arenosus]|uniref:AbrB family transcriptional regulator n=2 Tax=Oceanobacillus arenosus TaxID=1229153 RepID=A0A3D8PU70_9BACI|nr:hypothetical protein CWR48_12280 [Oceanobacillus arenosus]
MAKAFVIGLVGAMLFVFIGAPMPWMLGPLFAVLLTQLFTPIRLKWPPLFRNIGLAITGYLIGFAFTIDALHNMKQYFLHMIIINIAFFLLFLLISFLIAKRTGADQGTTMTSCIPGGLSQVVIFAEEQKNIDVTAVTFYHVLRVLIIVSIVPFIVTSEQTKNVTETVASDYSFYLIGILILCYFVGMLCNMLHIPTAYLLGAVFLIMCFNLANIDVPIMPTSLLHLAQLFLGIYIGLLLKKEDMKLSKRHIFYSFVSSGILIFFAFIISILMQKLSNMSFSTSFLSVVPGGLDQMGIIAASVHADVTIVTAFQLFRILFLSTLVIPFVKLVVNRKS